jgi:hypothetical protein
MLALGVSSREGGIYGGLGLAHGRGNMISHWAISVVPEV